MENIFKKSFGKTLTGKGLIGLILAAIVFVVSLCLPANETPFLSREYGPSDF